jgi:hypothetical protein
MLSVRGIYENGQVRLLEPLLYPRRAEVIVTILEEADIKNVPPFTGSLKGVGETVGDLTEPFEDEWEAD